ncbi:MAG: VPLPA-CTERM sorting domain-containing protein, partial [Pseudomonadota bacterium]
TATNVAYTGTFDINPDGTFSLFVDLDDGFAAAGIPFAWTWDITGTVDNLAPIPVPAAVWLFGSALVGLFGLRRRT